MARDCTFFSGRRVLPLFAGIALFTCMADNADAYVVKRTSRGELVHWEERVVSYTLDSSMGLSVDRGADATLLAMGSWSGTVGAPDLYAHAPDASSPTKPGYDQKNGIFFARGGYVPAGRALAITVLTYDNATGRILDSDVIVNGSYQFRVLQDPADLRRLQNNAAVGDLAKANTDGVSHDDTDIELTNEEIVYDLHHVVAHELGHSLGMNDEMTRQKSLMYRYSSPNDASVRTPASDDIEGLAELYSTKLEGRGNGCGAATVSPKKPSNAASQLAMLATLGLLAFLVLRAKKDRRARAAFVVAAAAAAIGALPSISKSGEARASTPSTIGHARAKVLNVDTKIDTGLFKTSYQLSTMSCNVSGCPKNGSGDTWGGTIGNLTQEVGGYYAPVTGDEVDVSFKQLKNQLRAISVPLGTRSAALAEDGSVAVVTKAN